MEVFPRLPLFEGISKEGLKRLQKQGKLVEIPRGKAAFRQGAPADHALLILKGRLKAFAEEGDRTRPVDDVLPGELVGEAALWMDGGVRTATLEAWADTQALRLSRADLEALSGTDVLAAIQRHSLRTSARRLRNTNHAVRREWAAARPEPAPTPAPEPKAQSTWSRLSALLGRLV